MSDPKKAPGLVRGEHVTDPMRFRSRPLCATSDPFAAPQHVPPTMTVMHGLSGPVMTLLSAEGEVALMASDIDALIRLARSNGMTR